ncbi:MAG: hypothetical protein B6I20_08115 [Bacteroidetes bacterium 4572_117]|nr:MAG: hypothetical protein B6I20_08115 [Bacteroidetes bacterium 4572_117]
MNLKTSFILIGIIIAVIFSCTKPRVYPVEPKINFKEMSLGNMVDTLGNEVKRIVLTISVEDGDGDIGLPENDTLPGFDTLGNKNLFIDIYNKVDGVFEKIELLAPQYFKTYFLEPKGQDKTLTADFEVTMDFTGHKDVETGEFIPPFDYDTVYFEFYLYDRELHKSNIDFSPTIPADTLGLITNIDSQ